MIPRSLLALSILASCADISGASSSLTGTDEAEHSQSNMGEKNREAVRAQIEANFLLDPGMAGLEEMVVVVSVSMNPDGSITSLELDPSTDNGHPNWKLFARSCLRAVEKSSPLKMPRDLPYNAWKEITLRFEGRTMANM